MRTFFLSLSARLAAAALTLGMAGLAQAADTPNAPPADTAAHVGPQTASSGVSDRIDWNVDYPSQLGPEGPQADSHVRSANRADVNEQPGTH